MNTPWKAQSRINLKQNDLTDYLHNEIKFLKTKTRQIGQWFDLISKCFLEFAFIIYHLF